MIGLSPKQKLRIDSLTSFVTISLLFVLATVVAVFLITEINLSTKKTMTELTPVPKLTDITPEELALERLKLPRYIPTLAASSTNVVNAPGSISNESSTQTGSTKILTDAEVVLLLAKGQNQVIQTVSSEPSNQSIPIVYELGADTIETGTVNSYVAATSEVDIEAITVSYGNRNEESVASLQVREGVVFAIDKNAKYLQLSSVGKSLTKINLAQGTLYYINGRPLALSSIRVGDIVRVEGIGFENVSEIRATSVSLTGVYEIVASS
jgi:hypothetical protein